MAVTSNTDAAIFVAFDGSVTKEINLCASEDAGGEAHEQSNIPQCLKEILGRTLTFLLKFSQFNFTSKHQSSSIYRVYDS
ncbi:hypothetical protein Bca4012_056317 [Brassica carinata]